MHTYTQAQHTHTHTHTPAPPLSPPPPTHKDGASSLERGDFAIGCFWGAEMAFQREPGVITTKVGYTQGQKDDPSYEEVCAGEVQI